MSFPCEFCDKYFSSRSSLNNHKSKTKYCLQIQKEKGLIDDIKRNENCLYCESSFLYKNAKIKHEEICKNKIILLNDNIKRDYELKIHELNSKLHDQDIKIQNQNDIINIYKHEIKILKEKEEFYKSELSKKDDLVKLSIEKSIEKSGVVNNTTMTTSSSNKQINKQVNITNCLDLSDERLKKAADNYTFDHYNRAEAGMVDWCINNVIKDKDQMLYRCTDKNRRVFTFKTILGDTILDPNATQLKSSIKPILAEKLKGYKKINCKLMGEDSDDDNNEKVDAYLRLHAINKEMGIEFEKELVKKTYNIT